MHSILITFALKCKFFPMQLVNYGTVSVTQFRIYLCVILCARNRWILNSVEPSHLEIHKMHPCAHLRHIPATLFLHMCDEPQLSTSGIGSSCSILGNSTSITYNSWAITFLIAHFHKQASDSLLSVIFVVVFIYFLTISHI